MMICSQILHIPKDGDPTAFYSSCLTILMAEYLFLIAFPPHVPMLYLKFIPLCPSASWQRITDFVLI